MARTVGNILEDLDKENVMGAVATVEQSGEVIDQRGGLNAVIERALASPATGIDVLERLLAMQERIEARTAKHDFTKAKIAMRAELPEVTMKGHIVIRKDDKIIQDTPFARFEDLHEAVMPVLTAHGFDLKFRTGLSPDGKVMVTTILAHVGGHEEETDFILPHDSSGSKNSVQAVGSSTSYGKRYGTLAILNIKVCGEDDDGTAASYKDSAGVPMPGAKLDGPHTSKTGLSKAVRELRNSVRACADVASLNALLKGAKATIDQAERDWPFLLTGDPSIVEDIGLRGEVEAKRAALRDGGSSAVDRLISSMRECESARAMTAWRDANENDVEALDGADARAFQRAWDQHEGVLA